MIVKCRHSENNFRRVIDCDVCEHDTRVTGGPNNENLVLNIRFFKNGKEIENLSLQEPVKIFFMNDAGKTVDSMSFDTKQVVHS